MASVVQLASLDVQRRSKGALGREASVEYVSGRAFHQSCHRGLDDSRGPRHSGFADLCLGQSLSALLAASAVARKDAMCALMRMLEVQVR
jgi:hypothetical protein